LLGMLTTTHYQMLTAESGIQQGIEWYFEFATFILTFRRWIDPAPREQK
jgi:hypothetical protein